MELETSIFELFEELLKHCSVISISGEAGTGKTSFALYLIGNLLDMDGSCVWIQASEIFPRNRLVTMFQDNKRQYLLENIFITPKARTFNSYHDQLNFLKQIASTNLNMPSDLQFIVIDNISHYLRLEFANVGDIKKKVDLLDRFYENVLYPLILKCQRQSISLVCSIRCNTYRICCWFPACIRYRSNCP